MLLSVSGAELYLFCIPRLVNICTEVITRLNKIATQTMTEVEEWLVREEREGVDDSSGSRRPGGSRPTDGDIGSASPAVERWCITMVVL